MMKRALKIKLLYEEIEHYKRYKDVVKKGTHPFIQIVARDNSKVIFEEKYILLFTPVIEKIISELEIELKGLLKE